MKQFVFIFLFIVLFVKAQAQHKTSYTEKDYARQPVWIGMMDDTTANFFEVERVVKIIRIIPDTPKAATNRNDVFTAKIGRGLVFIGPKGEGAPDAAVALMDEINQRKLNEILADSSASGYISTKNQMVKIIRNNQGQVVNLAGYTPSGFDPLRRNPTVHLSPGNLRIADRSSLRSKNRMLELQAIVASQRNTTGNCPYFASVAMELALIYALEHKKDSMFYFLTAALDRCPELKGECMEIWNPNILGFIEDGDKVLSLNLKNTLRVSVFAKRKTGHSKEYNRIMASFIRCKILHDVMNN